MGLNVEAYSKIELDDNQASEVVTDASEVEPRADVDDSVVQLDIRPAFAERAPEVVSGGWYRYADTFSFNVGGYSWFGLFRDALSRFIGAPSHPAFLENITRHKAEEPFFELLYFSDCDSTIGAGVCGKLARDFAEHEFSFRRRIDALARLTLEGMRDDRGGYGLATDTSVSEIARDFVELYANFKRAFQIGADSGAVKFT